MKTVAVDFDGVIHAYSQGWQDGSIYDPPVPGALDALRGLMDRYAVFVFTSRHKGQVAQWLGSRGFQVTTDDTPYITREDWDGKFWSEQGVLLVTNAKISAAAYIDDRAIRFTSWEQALADLDEVMPTTL